MLLHLSNGTDVDIQSEWQIRLIGGTVTGKFWWYLRVVGLSVLGLILSIVIGVAIGLVFSSGDAGILTATFLFVVSAIGALFYAKRRVVRQATLRLTSDSFTVVSKNKAIVKWPCQEIQLISCDSIAQGIGMSALLPSSFDKITIEHKNDSIVFEIRHEDALACVETARSLTANAVYTGAMIESHVPIESDRPDLVWRSKLRSELKNACFNIAFGLFGSSLLCLFAYGIWNRRQFQGSLGMLVGAIIVAVGGPFLLFKGGRDLFTYFLRRRQFIERSGSSDSNAVSKLISEIYGETDVLTAKTPDDNAKVHRLG